MKYLNPILGTDSYKLSHIKMTSNGVESIYSNLTPRFTKYMEEKYRTFDGGIVCFGTQYALQKILHEMWEENFFKRNKDEVISEAKDILVPYIGMDDLSHFEALHDLGYLPLEIKALPEGSVITAGIPCLTITNTHKDFQWLPNYLESILSTELWKPMTTATIGRTMRNLVNVFAEETEGNLDNTDYQLHDFSLRGQSGIESSAACGAGFLLNSKGTDNIPAISFINQYYGTGYSDDFNVANSVPAGEHSVTTLGIQINKKSISKEDFGKSNHEDLDSLFLHLAEIEYVEEIIKKFPTGIVSYVADSYDYFSFLDDVLTDEWIKESIMARDGKFVVRGDSGDPVDIIAGIKIPDYSQIENFGVAESDAVYSSIPDEDIQSGVFETVYQYKGNIRKVYYEVFCKNNEIDSVIIGNNSKYTLTTEEKGTIEKLWDIFGGETNSLGYKVLDSHIGMIYGDGITEERALEILTRLRNKGFASTNIVFGMGSYSLNMLSRDDLGTAIKATSAVVNGERVAIYKDPKTDSQKKSAKGLLKVSKNSSGVFILEDDVSEAEEATGELQTVWKDGKFIKTVTFPKVIENMKKSSC